MHSSTLPVEPKSFATLIGEAKRAVPEALDQLFERYYPVVGRMVHRRLEQDMRAARPWLAARFSTGDVVQDVFRAVLKDLRTFGGDTEGAFINYLAMVVRNRLVDAIRFHQAERRDGRRSEAPTGSWWLGATEDDPHNEAASADELVRLHGALTQLGEREQLLVRARLEGGESFESLAAQLGFGSETSARRAFYGAQARLAILLGDD